MDIITLTVGFVVVFVTAVAFLGVVISMQAKTIKDLTDKLLAKDLPEVMRSRVVQAQIDIAGKQVKKAEKKTETATSQGDEVIED